MILFRISGNIHEISKRSLPHFVIRGVSDLQLLWKLLIYFLEESDEPKISFSMTNLSLSKSFKVIRSLRNKVTHSNKVDKELLNDTLTALLTLIEISPTFLPNNEREKLNENISLYRDLLDSSGIYIKSNNNKDDQSFNTFVSLPKDIEKDLLSINTTEKDLQYLKETFRNEIKRRLIFVHNGKYRGQYGNFMMWNGNNCFIFFKDKGKRMVSCRVTVSVLISDLS